ncbi:MAG: outer membrane beta-barrel protein, partial [Candidatus Deferrimicrobiaceae bacterium]
VAMRRPMVALFVMFSLVSVPAFAQRLDNYATVKLGAYSPRSHFLLGKDFSKGIDGELALGRYFNRYLAGEFGLGYFKTTSGSDQITVVPVTVTGKGILPLGEVELYAGAGIGAYFGKAELGSQSYNDTALGWHILTGVDFNVMPNLFLGAEISYLRVKPSFGAWDSSLDGATATANVGIRF